VQASTCEKRDQYEESELREFVEYILDNRSHSDTCSYLRFYLISRIEYFEYLNGREARINAIMSAEHREFLIDAMEKDKELKKFSHEPETLDKVLKYLTYQLENELLGKKFSTHSYPPRRI
jgi:hypothetical protein